MELELKNIYKNFGEKQVLTGISLNAKSGEAFGLLGRNGAGKTTTIRILMNVFPANAGEVLVDGKPINYNKIGIGYLPEERGLYPKKPIIDQLIYFAQLKGMKYAPAVKSIDKWLENRTIFPLLISSFTTSFSNCALTGSSPENGSSRITISGLCASAVISCIFCWLPLLSVSRRLSR